MQRLSTRILSFLMAIIMMLSLTTSVFANAPTDPAESNNQTEVSDQTGDESAPSGETPVEPAAETNPLPDDADKPSPQPEVPSETPVEAPTETQNTENTQNTPAASQPDPVPVTEGEITAPVQELPRLTALYEGHRVRYYDSAKQPLPEHASLHMGQIDEEDIPFYLQRAAHALGLESCGMYLYFIADPILEDASTAEVLHYNANPDDPYDRMTVEVTLIDDADMTDEEKAQRLNYLHEIHIEDLQVILLGSTWGEDTLTPFTYDEETGVIRFTVETVGGFILLIPDWDSAVYPEEDEVVVDGTEIPTNPEVAEPQNPDAGTENPSDQTGDIGTQQMPAEPGAENPTGTTGNENPVPGADVLPSPDEPVAPTEQTVTASGADYSVSLTYSTDANIPEGAVFELSELPGSGIVHENLTDSVANTLNTSTEDIVSVTFVDVDVKKDGESVTPDADVSVSIDVSNHSSDDTVTQVVALGEQNEVLDSEGDSSSYTTVTDSLTSTYAIVRISKEVTLKTSDDQTYRITVTYDRDDPGIPVNVELVVKELKEGDPGYEDYISQCAETAGFNPETLNFAKAFDVSLIDPETGEECQPVNEVGVSIRLLDEDVTAENSVIDVVHFGEEPEKLESTLNGDAIEFSTPGFSVIVVASHTVETYYRTSEGETWKITVSYDIDSGIPEGAELVVSELSEDSEEFKEYLAQSAEKTGDDPEQLKFAKAFDIKLIDPETGKECEPTKNIAVSIELQEEVNENLKIDVVHFGDNDAVDQLECALNKENAIEFTTPGFSVFFVMATVLEKKLVASDGNTYLITVTYDNTSGIPSDSELTVKELDNTDPNYAEYMQKTAESLGYEAGHFAFAHAFDITLVNPESGEKYRPNNNVKVSIALMTEDVQSGDDVSVVHFKEAYTEDSAEADLPAEAYMENPLAGTETEVMDVSVIDGAVQFETTGFSVYVVVRTDSEPEEDTGWQKVSSLTELEELIQSDAELYVSNSLYTIPDTVNKYYFWKNEIVPDAKPGNNRSGIKRTDGTFSQAVSDDAAQYYFSKTADGKYQIYCYDSNNSQKYLWNVSNQIKFATSEADRTKFTINYEGDSKFTIKGSQYINLTSDSNGKGFAAWTEPNNGSKLHIWYYHTMADDPYELDDGNSYCIAYHGESGGAGLTATSSAAGRLDATELVSWSAAPNDSGELLIDGGLDLAEWTFTSIAENRYTVTTQINGTTYYLTLASGSLTLETSQTENSIITVYAGSGDYAGKYLFKSGNNALALDGGNASNGFISSAAEEQYTWLNLANKTTDYEETDLNKFVESGTYTINNSEEEYQLPSNAVVRPNDVFRVKLHFSEIAIGQDGARQLIIDQNTPLKYSLPAHVVIDGNVSDVSCSVPGVSNPFKGEVNYNSVDNNLELTWDYTGHTTEEIDAFKNAMALSFDMTVPVTIQTSSEGQVTVNFGNNLILTADTAHNPMVVSKSAGAFDVAAKTITYTAVVRADGNIDNNGGVYPVVIDDTIGTALSFKSGTFTYTHGSAIPTGSEESLITWEGGSQPGPTSSGVSFSGFPVTVNHMYDGDTITFTYVADVDISKIEVNGSATEAEAGNKISLTNSGNPYNETKDDNKDCTAEILYPELKKELKETIYSEFPVYKFVITVAGVTAGDLMNETLVIEDTLDTNESNAKLWKLCNDTVDYTAKAYGLNELTESLTNELTLSTITETEGKIEFTISNPQKNANEAGNDPENGSSPEAGTETVTQPEYWKFYKIVYYITPKDDTSLETLKHMAAMEVEEGETLGEQKFTNTAKVKGSVTLEDTADYIYKYLPITKSLSMDGNWAYYEIHVNPDAMILNGGNSMNLADVFYIDPENDDNGDPTNPEYIEMVAQYPNYTSQSIDYSSVNVFTVDNDGTEHKLSSQEDFTNAGVYYDYSGYVGTFTMPDQQHVKITYRTRVKVTEEQTVTFANTATLNSLFPAEIVTTAFIYPGGDDVIDTSGEYWIRLYKYCADENYSGHMERGLGGAVFRLLDSNQKPITYKRGDENKKGKEVTFTTGADGYALIKLDQTEDGVTLQKNTVYYLEEITAPVSGTKYYKLDNTLYGFLITDNPNYNSGGVWTYYNNDVLKVRNYEEVPGVYISKRFSGNKTLTETEKKAISFKLQKLGTDLDGKPIWETVTADGQECSIGYAAKNTSDPFYYGYYRFEASLEVGGKYRVIEETDPETGTSIIPATTYTVTLVEEEDGNTAYKDYVYNADSENFESEYYFEVTDLNNSHVINVLCENHYIENKLTIRKVDELDGKLLKDAVFTVYNMANQQIKSYTTDENGIAEISKDDPRYYYNTLYYAVETTAPARHILPEEPEKIYFYFSSAGKAGRVPEGLPSGESAIDLSSSYDAITITNKKSEVDIPVLKVWDINDANSWPQEVDHITVGLYRSIRGSQPTPVTDDEGTQLTLTLSKETPFDKTTFSNQPAADAVGNVITYSVKEQHVYADPEETQDLLENYAPSYSVTNAGVYVIKNSEGISITVSKKWYDSDVAGWEEITNNNILSGKQPVTFDIYRCTSEYSAEGYNSGDAVDRQTLEAFLRTANAELLQVGLTLSNSMEWRQTISSLEKKDEQNKEYVYYVVETENASYTDRYIIIPATETTDRELVIQNKGDAVPICKVGEETFFTLNGAMDYILEYDLYTATIEMLCDYVIPVTDQVEIPRGYSITLSTASTDDTETISFIPPTEDSTRETAILTRYRTFTDGALFTALGNLTLENITIDGDGRNNVLASRELIYNEGTLTIKQDASLQNAINSGKGGAVYSADGTVVLSGGSIAKNAADRGAAIYASGGSILISSGVIGDDDLTDAYDKANVACDGGAVYYAGTGNVTVEGGMIQGNKAVNGDGGAIYAASGTVTISGDTVFNSNKAQIGNGGAVYGLNTVVNVSTKTTSVSGGQEQTTAPVFAKNSAVSGGAVYIGTGSINISGGSFTENEAKETESNNKYGGAVYLGSGSVSITDGSFTQNKAGTYGGAVYTDSGSITMSGGSMTKNEAVNGSAVFVNTGAAEFSSGIIGDDSESALDANIASQGGAVGVGSENARLTFSGNIVVAGNKIGTGESAAVSNVYLDQDTDAVINVVRLANNEEAGYAKIGVYVPNKEITVDGQTVDLYERRGIPGSKFATYSGQDINTRDKEGKLKPQEVSEGTFKAIITSDRASDLEAIADTSVKRVIWGKSIQVQIRYLQTYNSNGTMVSMPKNGDSWRGRAKYPKDGDNTKFFDFYPASSNSALSEVAENLRSRYTVNLGSSTAVYGHSFNYDATTFGDYLTNLFWDKTEGKWKLEKRNGDKIDCDKVVIFYTEPSYISIENNTEADLDITSLTVLGQNVVNTADRVGYGYVTAKNGETRSSLLPPDASKDLVNGHLKLLAGESIKLLFPGAVNSPYVLQGKYSAAGESGVKVFRTNAATPGAYIEETIPQDKAVSGFDPPLSGNTLSTNGGSYEIIFGKLKPVCRIVSGSVGALQEGEHAGNTELGEREDSKIEYLFSSISQAVSFVQAHITSKTASIEMLVDYLLPSTDLIQIPAEYKITLTTAVDGVKKYSADKTARASISRDIGNKNSFINVPVGGLGTELNVENLKFDGRNLAGNSDGGTIKTKNCKVTITNCEFKNFIAGNGGAIYIEFGETYPVYVYKDGVPQVDNNGNYKVSGYIYEPDRDESDYGEVYDSTLSIKESVFINCQSNSTANRQGGGAVWTNAKNLRIDKKGEDGKGCRFENCIAYDQGGAVFHRIDKYVAGSSTYAESCTFSNCEARAAGAFETDASSVEMIDCHFSECSATQRNGGAMNVYSNNSAATTEASEVKVTGCSFDDCHADNTGEYYGGALRSAAIKTTVENCSFSNSSSNFGGAIAISNVNAEEGSVLGCTINYSKAHKQGGGIYSRARTFVVDDFTSEGVVFNTTITGCTATEKEGGGIYSYCNVAGSSCEITNCSVVGCSTPLTGGGIYAYAPSCTLVGCILQNNTAGGDGGGICDPYKGTTLKLDGCVLTGNTSGGRGGGAYSVANVTLCNDSFVLGNRLSHNNRENAAGIYVTNTLTVGVDKSGTENAQVKDNSTVKENYTAGGISSNLRLWYDNNNKRNYTSSVSVLCNLGGEIYVVNAAAKGTQFGNSGISFPSGFADLRHVFTADDGSLYGIIDRTDGAGKKLVWAGDPICKLTDDKGNMLYFDEAHTESAIFDKLDVGNYNTANKTSVFSALRMRALAPTAANYLKLYTQTGEEYLGNTFIVKMLDDYSPTKWIQTPTSTSMNITLTTAGTSEADGYSFRGLGNRATITRNTGGNNWNLFTAKANLTIQNVVLDGGTRDPANTARGVNTRILKIDDNITVTLGKDCILQYSESTEKGGGIQVNNGSLVLSGGAIRYCNVTGGDGGAIWVNNGKSLTISDGSIMYCTASGKGGGVYNNGSLTMSGGSITRCTALNGGGVFVEDGKTLNMSGGRITLNSASAGGSGGGIAIGGKSKTKLTFFDSVYVSGNTKNNEDCNLELNQDSNAIITANGLSSTANIGVYVPGEMNQTNEAYNDSSNLYKKYGDADCQFGVYVEGSDTDNLRCFVNDRNKLRGGPKTGDSNKNKVFWVKIYFLEISKQVLSDKSSDMNREFTFSVTLEGQGIDKDGNPVDAGSINSINADDYGEIFFKNGRAYDPLTEKYEVTLEVKNGEGSIMAENLPGGLTFTVEELLTDEDASYFATICGKGGENKQPGREVKGDIGKKEVGSIASYLSSAEFTNIHAICKITSKDGADSLQDGTLLYYKQKGLYEPAVYSKLAAAPGTAEKAAFKTINSYASSPLYYFDGTEYKQYSGNYYVEMLLADYDMKTPVTLTVEKLVVLTTADKNADDGYPYAGGDITAVIMRSYTGGSMFAVKRGTLDLEKITLDGNKNGPYSVSGNGGILSVGDVTNPYIYGNLGISSQASLLNSKANNGGAVYVAANGIVGVNGGTINGNTASNGAGIYLAEGSKLNLSGNPDFGGTGVENNHLVTVYQNGEAAGNFVTGTLNNAKNGGKDYTYARQDVFIERYKNNNIEDTSADSLVVTGNITSGNGTIWVWAAESPRYVTLRQFAKYEEGVTDTANSFAAFRNARSDVDSGADQEYLYGITKEDDTGRNVFWSGLEGSRRVVLRKVNSSYSPLDQAEFIVYKGDSTTAYEGLEPISTANGVLWVGTLPYGTYILHEKSLNGIDQNWWYKLTVDKSGVEIHTKQDVRPDA